MSTSVLLNNIKAKKKKKKRLTDGILRVEISILDC